jgi:antitoxin component of MazEF toxin-antitoxin module
MIQQLRKSGNSYVVTVPKELVERNGWEEGEYLEVEVTPIEMRPVLSADLREAMDQTWDDIEPALRYLADR